MSPVICSIETGPRGVAAVLLDTDGEDGVPTLLPLESLVLHHLREGAQVDEDDWQRIRREGQITLATRRGLDLLARRQRTERELSRALARTYDAEAVEAAVQRLRELGYLDDATVAQGHVASGRAAERGSALLRQELRRRGVEDNTVAEALEGRDDLDAARAAAERRVRSLRNLDPDRRVRRLYDFLRRRGFSDPVARRALSEALEEESVEEVSGR